MKELRKLRSSVQKVQDEKRFEHTIGVEYTAASLAMRYGVDIKSARIAGILHDCAKCLSDKKQLEICKKNKIAVTDVEKRNPFLLHAKVGAFLAHDKYEVTDENILDAICYHTTGRADMSDLEKIIFIADYIEPGRNKAANLDVIRKTAFEDLNKAMIIILENTLGYLKKSGNEIDPMTEQTLNFYHKL